MCTISLINSLVKNSLKKSNGSFIFEDTCGPADFSSDTNSILRGIFSDSIHIIHLEFSVSSAYIISWLQLLLSHSLSIIFIFSYTSYFISIFIMIFSIINFFMNRISSFNNEKLSLSSLELISLTQFILKKLKNFENNISIATTIKLRLTPKMSSDPRSRFNLRWKI